MAESLMNQTDQKPDIMKLENQINQVSTNIQNKPNNLNIPSSMASPRLENVSSLGTTGSTMPGGSSTASVSDFLNQLEDYTPTIPGS